MATYFQIRQKNNTCDGLCIHTPTDLIISTQYSSEHNNLAKLESDILK